MNLQSRLDRLRKSWELARQDYERMSAQMAELLRKDPDNVVELAMMRPMVEAAHKRMLETEMRLRTAAGGVRHRPD